MNYIYNYSLGDIGSIRYFCNNKPILNSKECTLFPQSRENLRIFRNKYSKMSKINKEDDMYYVKYITKIYENLQKCPNCNKTCCSFCRKNNAVHPDEKCLSHIREICTKEYSTWRSYFSWNPTLASHEEAIIDSYTESLRLGLWGGGCPCQIVSKKTNNGEIMRLLSTIPKEALDYHINIL